MHSRTALRWILSIGGLVLFAFSIPARAHAQSEVWQPPEPASGAYDWIRLTSGEWLKGEITSLRDLEFEFDSDELDALSLDWEDVAELRSPRILTYRIEDGGIFAGTATIRDSVLAVRGVDGEVHEFERSKLLLILEGAGSEWDFWSAKATIGLVGRAGNTRQSDLNTSVRIRRRAPRSRLVFDYLGNMGTVEDEATIDNHNISTNLDMVISAGFFFTPLAVNLTKDRFQNIEFKLTGSTGIGYDVFRGGDFEWRFTMAGGYQGTKYISIQPGQDDAETNFSAIPSTDLEIDFTKDLELLFHYDAQIGVPDPKRTFHHASGTISFDILGDLIDLDVSATWDRTESPKADSDGNIPAKDDFRTTLGFGIEL